VKQRTRDNE